MHLSSLMDGCRTFQMHASHVPCYKDRSGFGLSQVVETVHVTSHLLSVQLPFERASQTEKSIISVVQVSENAGSFESTTLLHVMCTISLCTFRVILKSERVSWSATRLPLAVFHFAENTPVIVIKKTKKLGSNLVSQTIQLLLTIRSVFRLLAMLIEPAPAFMLIKSYIFSQA
jgi:hypothetical protein